MSLQAYIVRHERLEEEALGDPLHARSLPEKATFYGLYLLEALTLLPYNPPFTNYRLYTEPQVRRRLGSRV